MNLLIDFGGTTLRYLIHDDNSNIVEKNHLNSKDVSLVNFIETQILKYNLTFVGVSFAGQVMDGVIKSAPNINIDEFDIKTYFTSKYNIEFEIQNDLKCAALAEYSTKKESKMLVLIYIGTGIGASFVHEGKLIQGSLNLAGEIGHIPYKKAPFLCGCGKDDCLELYASGSGIQKWMDYYHIHEDIDLKMFQNEKDVNKLLIYDNFIEAFSKICAAIITIFNPDFLILGGGVIEKNSFLITIANEAIKKMAFSKSSEFVKVEQSTFENGCLVGAELLKKQK